MRRPSESRDVVCVVVARESLESSSRIQQGGWWIDQRKQLSLPKEKRKGARRGPCLSTITPPPKERVSNCVVSCAMENQAYRRACRPNPWSTWKASCFDRVLDESLGVLLDGLPRCCSCFEIMFLESCWWGENRLSVVIGKFLCRDQVARSSLSGHRSHSFNKDLAFCVDREAGCCETGRLWLCACLAHVIGSSERQRLLLPTLMILVILRLIISWNHLLFEIDLAAVNCAWLA